MVQVATQTFENDIYFGQGNPTSRKLSGRKDTNTFRKYLENTAFQFDEIVISFLREDLAFDTNTEKDFIEKLDFSRRLKDKAFQYMDLIVEGLHSKGYQEIEKPGISLFEDGLLIEWIIPHARLGLFFDPEDESGSYYSFTDNSKDGIQASGPLNPGIDSLLVATFIHQVESLIVAQ